MKQRLLAMVAMLAAPGMLLAHHGDEADLTGQLLHASFDPLHLGMSLLAAAGLYGLYRLIQRHRSRR